MFDFTKNVQLDQSWQKKYAVARMLLYFAFLGTGLLVANKILFPSVSLNFFFQSVNSLKNTLVFPRTELQPTMKNGRLTSQETLTFNANPSGHFSDAKLAITTDKNTTIAPSNKISVRKAYTAFFYPTGQPAGFRNGSLIISPNRDYYLVSQGKLRKFANTNVLQQLGFSKEAFLPAAQEDLQLNPAGEDITSSTSYPDDTLFAIGNTFYQMADQQLLPFVSKRAFLTNYDETQAITKTEDFLRQHTVSETMLGFADGTLASSELSVFILSKGKSYPIKSAETFTTLGYDWADVIKLDPEEFGLYARQKQFTDDQPHPDGTIFVDSQSDDYFLIENNQKLPITSPAVLKTYLRNSPIMVDSRSLTTTASCTLLKNKFSSNVYSCTFPLTPFEGFFGNDYQLDAAFNSDVSVQTMQLTFFTPLSWQNLRDSLSDIKKNLQGNYIQTP